LQQLPQAQTRTVPRTAGLPFRFGRFQLFHRRPLFVSAFAASAATLTWRSGRTEKYSSLVENISELPKKRLRVSAKFSRHSFPPTIKPSEIRQTVFRSSVPSKFSGPQTRTALGQWPAGIIRLGESRTPYSTRSWRLSRLSISTAAAICTL